MAALVLEEEVYGPLLPYIRRPSVTDINYNGKELWIDDVELGRYQARDVSLSDHYVRQFSIFLANRMNRNFNQYEPWLEAETPELRISLIHEAVTNTGRSLSIRKTPGVRRINSRKMIEEGFCDTRLIPFMENCVRAGLSIMIAGLPGAGKTEYLKYLTGFIPPEQKVITIEDSLEIRYRTLNPHKDGIELKVGETFSYEQAIKASMRQLPHWLLLSEARSREVTYLLEALSTGVRCMTTIHTDDVRKIPDRICNMMKGDVTNDVYTFVDVGVLIGCYHKPDQGISRRIEQVCLFERREDENFLTMVYEDGRMNKVLLSPSLERKFRFEGIQDPFEEAPY